MKQKKTASILRKFLLFNLSVFSILGLFTIVYLKAIQPNLIKNRTADHFTIIKNTIDHLKRLNINYNSKEIRTFNVEKMWGLGTPEDLNYYLENIK